MKKIATILFLSIIWIPLFGQVLSDTTGNPGEKNKWAISMGISVITMPADNSYPHYWNSDPDKYKNTFGFLTSASRGRISPVLEVTYSKYHSLGIAYSSNIAPDFVNSELKNLQFHYRLNSNFLNCIFKRKRKIEPFVNIQYSFNYKKLKTKRFVYPLPLSWNCNPPNPMYEEDRFVSMIQLVAGIKSNGRGGFFIGLNMNVFAASFGKYSSLEWGAINPGACEIITASGRTDDVILLDKLIKDNFFIHNTSLHFTYKLNK